MDLAAFLAPWPFGRDRGLIGGLSRGWLLDALLVKYYNCADKDLYFIINYQIKFLIGLRLD
jgi:hypothetical protein